VSEPRIELGDTLTVTLPYGHRPLAVELRDRAVEVLTAPELPEPRPVLDLLRAALDVPIGGPRLAGKRVTLIVSDPSRSEPRAELVQAVRERLPGAQWTLAVATGTHGRCRLDELGIPPSLSRDMLVVNHDGRSECVELGTTARGTPVRVHRCVLEADLVVATGCVRPHYFAGFGAGAKAVFPGLGESNAIRINHRLKTAAGARAGSVDENPCRADLEEAVGLVTSPIFLLNGVCGPDDRVHAAVAGHIVGAFRVAAARARSWFTVRARPAPIVLASDGLPVTASLYQAAKIAAAAAPLVEPGGTLVVVAECASGIEPIDVVNEAIFRIGVLPRLAPRVRLALVSTRTAEEVGRTLLDHEPSLDGVLARSSGLRTIVVPRASQLIVEVDS
jgi:nickel-dependent lactate racemase